MKKEKSGKMKIRVSFFGILIFLSLIVTRSYVSLVAMLAAAIHEAAHIFAARLCKIKIEELRLDIFGAALKTKKQLSSYWSEILLALSGPMSNMICAVLVFVLFGGDVTENDFVSMFLSASLFLGMLNLLPIKDFDGGRVVYCFFEWKFSPYVASKIQRILSFFTVFALWLFSVYLLLRLGTSLSLFVFSSALFAKIFIADI